MLVGDKPNRFGARAINRHVADDVVNVIFQLRSAHLQFLDFLVRCEIDVFFDAINFIVEAMVFLEDASEVVARALEPPDDLTVFREFSQDRMMQVHWDNLLFWFYNRVYALATA
jgi:hypothetical protein